jgi:hypothetical protein
LVDGNTPGGFGTIVIGGQNVTDDKDLSIAPQPPLFAANVKLSPFRAAFDTPESKLPEMLNLILLVPNADEAATIGDAAVLSATNFA